MAQNQHFIMALDSEYEDIDVFITDQELKPNQLSLFEKSTNILY